MARSLTKKQRGFIKDYLETGNGTQSALKHYNIEGKKPEKIASVIAVENLAKPSVIAYLESKADRAAERIVELSEQNDALPVALGASKDILDRTGYKPLEKSVTMNVQIETPPKLKELATNLHELLKRGTLTSG